MRKKRNDQEQDIDTLFIEGKDTIDAPVGWTTPITGRADTYNAAMKHFK